MALHTLTYFSGQTKMAISVAVLAFGLLLVSLFTYPFLAVFFVRNSRE
jgi:hypothetical protein